MKKIVSLEKFKSQGGIANIQEEHASSEVLESLSSGNNQKQHEPLENFYEEMQASNISNHESSSNQQ